MDCSSFSNSSVRDKLRWEDVLARDIVAALPEYTEVGRLWHKHFDISR